MPDEPKITGEARPERLFAQYSHEREVWDLFWEGDRSRSQITADFAKQIPTSAGRIKYYDWLQQHAATQPASIRNEMTEQWEEPPPIPYRTDGSSPGITSQAQSTSWSIRNGFWAFQGVRATNATTGDDLQLALETPLLMNWFARCLFLIAPDQLVFRWGRQIVVADLKTRQLGLLAIGTGPLVVEDADLLPAAAPR